MKGGRGRIRQYYRELTPIQLVEMTVRLVEQHEADEIDVVRASMSREERLEYDRRLFTLRQLEHHIQLLQMFLRQKIDKARADCVFPLLLRSWADEYRMLEWALYDTLREPISEAELAEEVSERRGAFLPARHFEEVLPFAAGMDDGRPSLENSSKQKVLARLRELAASGELASRGKGRGLKLERGAVDDWLGRETEAFPEWPRSYESFPAPRAGDLDQACQSFQFIKDSIIDKRPLALGGQRLTELQDQLAEAVAARTRRTWSELRALASILGQLQRDFPEAGPLLLGAQEEVKLSIAEVVEVGRLLQLLGRELDEPDPDEELSAVLGALIERLMKPEPRRR